LSSSLAFVQRSKSLQEQAYQSLRSSILLGELAPGQRLVETQLAEKLQVSRTPIREALRQLQSDALVTLENGNLRVATISVTDVVQLYDCRIALERLAVQGACQQGTPGQLHGLKQFVEQAENLDDQDHYSPAMLDLDHQFHHHIAECSGNPWLVGLLDQVFDKMALMRVQTTRHDPHVLDIRGEHRLIYEAIAHRAPDAALKAIESHLVSSKNRVAAIAEHLTQADW
jgi:DNA-binding GntR family transcriptional regulator